MQPRYYKLQEFQANLPAVNCVSIGSKSTCVLATGGEDKLVNLWTIGTAQRTMCLTGHTAPVESVLFDKAEEVVAAGSASGSIKIWDLNSAQSVARSLPGHKCNVRCLDFSEVTPNSLLSGSNDSNAKVWDLRNRDPTVTLKAHDRFLTKVKFSPDETQVATADEGGHIKMWDLRNPNKPRKELDQHTHAITGLQFHPGEMLLGSCSADKTVKMWDVDTGDLVQSTSPEATGIRAMAFYPGEGSIVFSCLADGMKVWEYEPQATQMDFIDVPWTKIDEVVVTYTNNQYKVMGCSFTSAFVGVWAVYLDQVHPFCGPPPQPAGNSQNRDNRGVRQALHNRFNSPSASGPTPPAPPPPPPQPLAHRGPIAPAQPPPPPFALHDSPSPPRHNHHSHNAAAASVPAAPNMHDYALRRNGQFSDAAYGIVGNMAQQQQQQGSILQGAGGGGGVGGLQKRASQEPGSLEPALQGLRIGEEKKKSQPQPEMLVRQPPPPVLIRRPSPTPDQHAPPPQHYQQPQSQPQPAAPARAAPEPVALPPVPQPPQMVSVGVAVGDSLRLGQAGGGGGLLQLAAAAEQPEQRLSREEAAVRAATAAVLGSADPLGDLLRRCEVGMERAHQQEPALARIKTQLGRGELKAALQTARRCPDAMPAATMLEGLMKRRGFQEILDLSCLPELVPVLEAVLSLKTDEHVEIATDLSLFICKNLGPTIRDVSSAAKDNNKRLAVDMAFEQRKAKCDAAKMVLDGLKGKVARLLHTRTSSGKLSSKLNDLADQLRNICDP